MDGGNLLLKIFHDLEVFNHHLNLSNWWTSEICWLLLLWIKTKVSVKTFQFQSCFKSALEFMVLRAIYLAIEQSWLRHLNRQILHIDWLLNTRYWSYLKNRHTLGGRGGGQCIFKSWIPSMHSFIWDKC